VHLFSLFFVEFNLNDDSDSDALVAHFEYALASMGVVYFYQIGGQ
jgi:hypothetical protein